MVDHPTGSTPPLLPSSHPLAPPPTFFPSPPLLALPACCMCSCCADLLFAVGGESPSSECIPGVPTGAVFGGCGHRGSRTGPGADKGRGGAGSPGGPRRRGCLLGTRHRYSLFACTAPTPHMAFLHWPHILSQPCRPEAGRTLLRSPPLFAGGGAA